MSSLLKLRPGFKVNLEDIRARAAPKADKAVGELTPTLRANFLRLARAHATITAEKIARGELDRWGNAPGTEYWDEEAGIKKQRRKRIGSYRKARISVGAVFGDLTIVKRAPKPVKKPARQNLLERWTCKCSCERVIVVPRYYLLRKPNPKTHCGCKVRTLKSSNQREYRIWHMIHQRCFNPNHVSYANYQAKGISLHEEWHKKNKDGFRKFLEEVGRAPNQYHTLDRIHNGRGYIPGNLR